MTLTDEQIAEWERLCEAAGGRPWWARQIASKVYKNGEWFVTAVPPDHRCWRDDLSSWVGIGVWDDRGATTKAIAEHIAAFSPEAVRALLAELRRVRGERDEARDRLAKTEMHSDDCTGPILLPGGRAIMAEGRGNDSVLWFTDQGMGPNPTEWTVEAFDPPEPGAASHVGIRFHGEGGPFMSPATARLIGTALIAAADRAENLREANHE